MYGAWSSDPCLNFDLTPVDTGWELLEVLPPVLGFKSIQETASNQHATGHYCGSPVHLKLRINCLLGIQLMIGFVSDSSAAPGHTTLNICLLNCRLCTIRLSCSISTGSKPSCSLFVLGQSDHP